MVAFKSLMITAALFSVGVYIFLASFLRDTDGYLYVVSAIPSWRINVKDADVSASGDAPAPPATTAVVVAPVSDVATSPQPDDSLAPAPAPPVVSYILTRSTRISSLSPNRHLKEYSQTEPCQTSQSPTCR